MKKLIAATFLFIYLFNIGGQVILHQYFSYLSDKFFNEQTSKGLYNVHDLTEVKLPANMPGISEWGGYEDIRGQIQFGDNTYNYVKMKITRTAVYLMCVPDYSTTTFSNQNVINAKGIKDVRIPKKEHVPYGKTTLMSTVNFAFAHFEFSSFFKNIQVASVPFVQGIACHFPDIPEQPPKFSC